MVLHAWSEVAGSDPPRARTLGVVDGSALAGGDRDSTFATFVRQQQSLLVGFATLVAGDRHTAEDLVQNALVKAYFKWNKIGADRFNTLAYVRRIIVNEHTDLWRRAFRRKERLTDELPEPAAAPDEPVDLWQHVLRLPPRQREVIALRYYSDLSVAETAVIMRCSEGTVKSQTNRAVGTLKSLVEQEDRT